MMSRILWLSSLFLLASCTSTGSSLYEDLGGEAGIEKITGEFLIEIGDDPEIRPYFEESDLDRFFEKFNEHMCEVSGGPCAYTGDDMVKVHQGMNINETDFNRVVDLLINAMTRVGVPHPVQNRLLARLAPMRGDMLYR